MDHRLERPWEHLLVLLPNVLDQVRECHHLLRLASVHALLLQLALKHLVVICLIELARKDDVEESSNRGAARLIARLGFFLVSDLGRVEQLRDFHVPLVHALVGQGHPLAQRRGDGPPLSAGAVSLTEDLVDAHFQDARDHLGQEQLSDVPVVANLGEAVDLGTDITDHAEVQPLGLHLRRQHRHLLHLFHSQLLLSRSARLDLGPSKLLHHAHCPHVG
mmetsp:Transcript_15890/g.37103  ORF Transcript_15890/g.37103 Transcript_15890/m.37103 type:complete len:219 (-) Transcript_15890:1283-1939(-)